MTTRGEKPCSTASIDAAAGRTHLRHYSHALQTQAINLLLRGASSRYRRTYDPQRTILIAGSPRSGTTWIAETICRIRGLICVWEPFQASLWPQMLEIGFRSVPAIQSIEALSPAQQAFVEGFMRPSDLQLGHIHLPPTALGERLATLLADLISFDRLVVKFVRGNLAVHAIQRRYGCPAVFLLRHPCAVVSSQIRKKAWGRAVAWKRNWAPLLEARAPELAPIVECLETAEEVLAFDWVVQNLLPLRAPGSETIPIVRYEDLLLDRRAMLEKLFRHLGVTLSEDIIRLSVRPSKTTVGSIEDTPQAQINRWQRELDNATQRRVLRVLEACGVDYDRDFASTIV